MQKYLPNSDYDSSPSIKTFGSKKKKSLLIATGIIGLGILSAVAILVSQSLQKKQNTAPEKSSAQSLPSACATVRCDGQPGDRFWLTNIQYYPPYEGSETCESCALDPLSCLGGGDDSEHLQDCEIQSGETSCSWTVCKECGGVQIHSSCNTTDAQGVSVAECSECSETPPPPPPPSYLSCDSLTMNPTNPQVGDTVSFNCDGHVTSIPGRVAFKVVPPNGNAEEFFSDQVTCHEDATGYQCTGSFTYPYVIENGVYKVCSKVCVNATCTEYDERCI